MEPMQIVRLIVIIFKIVIGVIGIIHFAMLSKKIKANSDEDRQLTTNEQTQVKAFAIVAIIYLVINCVDIILRIIADVI